MDKKLTTEMQATLRTLRQVGFVIECDAEQCHGDAKGELIVLIANLRTGKPGFELGDRERIADQAQAALDVHETRGRIRRMAALHDALWRRVMDFMGPPGRDA